MICSSDISTSDQKEMYNTEPAHADSKDSMESEPSNLQDPRRWPLYALRHGYREYAAEFWGTLVLIFFGNGTNATVKFAGGYDYVKSQSVTEWMCLCLGWGMALTMGLYVSMAISGGHLNPAVTLANACFGTMPWSKVPGFIVAQILGAMTGSACMYGLFRDHFIAWEKLLPAGTTMVQSIGGIFCTYPSVSTGSAVWSEFINTAVLIMCIMGIVNEKMFPAVNFKPVAVGMIVLTIGLCTGYNTGYAINPARDLGPRIISALLYGSEPFTLNDHYFLIPLLVPIVGAIAGMFLFSVFVVPT